MLPDLVDLGRGEGAGLDQRRVRDADHSDVVHAETVRKLRLEYQLGCDLLGEQKAELSYARRVRGRLAVAAAPVVVKLERPCKRLDRRGGRVQG